MNALLFKTFFYFSAKICINFNYNKTINTSIFTEKNSSNNIIYKFKFEKNHNVFEVLIIMLPFIFFIRFFFIAYLVFYYILF